MHVGILGILDQVTTEGVMLWNLPSNIRWPIYTWAAVYTWKWLCRFASTFRLWQKKPSRWQSGSQASMLLHGMKRSALAFSFWSIFSCLDAVSRQWQRRKKSDLGKFLTAAA